MIEREPMTGEEIMAAAVNNLERTVRDAEAGNVDNETVDYVFDKTMRTIAELAFGQCDYPRYCKFYGENPSFCDRSCNMDIWDQI